MVLEGCASRAMGQSYSAEVWPLFLPQPVNGGIRRIRAYKPSTVVMGRRELLRTTLYDRQGYWSANGKIIGTRTSTSNPFTPSLNTDYNNINTAVRCVYDAWYWGEEPVQENATTWLGFYDN